MYRCLIGHQLPGFLREMDSRRDEFRVFFKSILFCGYYFGPWLRDRPECIQPRGAIPIPSPAGYLSASLVDNLRLFGCLLRVRLAPRWQAPTRILT